VRIGSALGYTGSSQSFRRSLGSGSSGRRRPDPLLLTVQRVRPLSSRVVHLSPGSAHLFYLTEAARSTSSALGGFVAAVAGTVLSVGVAAYASDDARYSLAGQRCAGASGGTVR
jgi:hypothetical protein